MGQRDGFEPDTVEIGSLHVQYSNKKVASWDILSINWSVAMVTTFAHSRWAVPTLITHNFYLIQVLGRLKPNGASVWKGGFKTAES